MIASAHAIITLAAKSGASALIIADIVLLCVPIGVDPEHRLRTYDLEDAEGEISFNDSHYRFKKKYSQKHSAKERYETRKTEKIMFSMKYIDGVDLAVTLDQF